MNAIREAQGQPGIADLMKLGDFHAVAGGTGPIAGWLCTRCGASVSPTERTCPACAGDALCAPKILPYAWKLILTSGNEGLNGYIAFMET